VLVNELYSMSSLLSQLAGLLTRGNKPTADPSGVTYRARNIPERYTTREGCQKIIEASLSTPDAPCTIRVRSFATNIECNPTRTTTTRTLTFNLNAGHSVRLKPNAYNEWTFEIFDDERQQSEDYLTIDTHFNGFTVLSSPEGDDHEFEYLLSR